MLTIVNIVLTVLAWRKGWRAQALIPYPSALAAAFFIGFMLGASGAVITFDLATVVGIIMEFGSIAVLSRMVARGPRQPQALVVPPLGGEGEVALPSARAASSGDVR